jgi:predicted site-specific integrase-resolvase
VNGWAKIKPASKHAGVSERTIRTWLKEGLPHSRLPSGTVLIKYEWIDEYLGAFAIKEDQVDKIVTETLGKRL